MHYKKKLGAALLALTMLSSTAMAVETKQTFDFETDDSGFVPIFADYPAEEGADAFYELQHQWTTLPSGSGKGLFLSGNNHSDDLFMGYYKEISGLTADQLYSFQVNFRLATNVEGGQIGVGGSPGSSVYVKGGITTQKPQRYADNLQHYHLNIQKGNQGIGGCDMLLLGNLEKEDEQKPGEYEWKTFSFTMQAKANDHGCVYLILGTDSGFEATSAYYLDDITLNWDSCSETAITRGAAVQMMYDTVQPAGTQVPSFTDLDTQSPYYTAVGWAQEKGLVNGYGTSRFGAEDTLTVPQTMMILYRYAGSPQVKADASMQVPAWAKDCMTWGLQKGLISPQDCIGEKEMSEYAFTHAWQEGIW